MNKDNYITINELFLRTENRTIMKIYAPFFLKDVAQGISKIGNSGVLNLILSNRLTDRWMSEVTYGLSLFRQAILDFETSNEVLADKSKAGIPFFRENLNLLVGPEMHIYGLRLYETYASCLNENPDLILTLDYDKLAEHCIFENMFLLKCKYDEAQNLNYFKKQLEKEYDKFFYDEEYTGFAPDSRFFSLLCTACLEMRAPQFAEKKEWMLASLVMPDDAIYHYQDGSLQSYSSTAIPFDIVEQISMPEYEKRKDEYTAIAGLLKQKGIQPEGLLEGFE